MNTQNDLEIKLDAAGNPDALYYIDKAHNLRSEFVGTQFFRLKSWIKARLSHGAGNPAHGLTAVKLDTPHSGFGESNSSVA